MPTPSSTPDRRRRSPTLFWLCLLGACAPGAGCVPEDAPPIPDLGNAPPIRQPPGSAASPTPSPSSSADAGGAAMTGGGDARPGAAVPLDGRPSGADGAGEEVRPFTPRPPAEDRVTRDEHGVPRAVSLPALNDYDLGGYQPPADFMVRPFASAAPPARRRLNVLDDGSSWSLPPCSLPVRLTGGDRPPPTIDGDLADWAGMVPAIVDRQGDGNPSASGAKVDLLRVYHRRDPANDYFAFVLREDWPSDDQRSHLVLSSLAITLPPSKDQPLEMYPLESLFVYPHKVTRSASSGPDTPLPAGSTSLAARGRILELRLGRTELADRTQGRPLVVRVAARGGADTTADLAGELIAGLTTDYACAVGFPGRRWKLFVLHRSQDLPAERAEVSYRAALTSAPYIESLVGASYDVADTMNVIVVPAMSADGLLFSGRTMVLSDGSPAWSGQSFSPLDRFDVAAHEYAHALNAVQWKLPRRWMREGHSEQSAALAVAAAFHPAVAEWRLRWRLQMLLSTESPDTPLPLDSEPWPADTGKYYYYKGQGFMDILATLLPYSTLTRVLARHENRTTAYTGAAELMEAITREPGFSGPVSASMWDGWLSGRYEAGRFPRSLIEADSDADGLLDLAERRLGLAPDRADTDGDSIGDLYEVGLRQDARRSDPPAGIVVDHHLGDWDRLAPGLLRPVSGTTRSQDAACRGVPRLGRTGILFDGDWLVVGVELAAGPVQPHRLAVFFNEPGGREVSLVASTSRPTMAAYQRDTTLRTAALPAPMAGNQTELPYRARWFGWPGGPPAGLEVKVSVAPIAGGTMVCEITAGQPVSSAVP